MSFDISIHLASWENGRIQQYQVDNSYQLADLLYSLLATRYDTTESSWDSEDGQTFIFKSCGDEVIIKADKVYGDQEEIGQNFIQEITDIWKSKFSFVSSFKDFLKKILNPFRWARHGLTFAALITVIGIGALSSGGLLPGLALLGMTIGLPMLLIAGLAETILEYWQAHKDIRSHAFAAQYFINYGFFSYLYDVVKYWGGQYKGQATILGFGIGLFILALIFTIPYCVDPTGSFSSMSVVMDPIVHFFSQGIDALSVMPQFEFLSAFQQPAAALGLAAGLLISSTLAVPLTLKNFIQGGYEAWDSKYRYEEEDVNRQRTIDGAYNPPAPDLNLTQANYIYKQFLSTGFQVNNSSPYSGIRRDVMKEQICERERELVIR